MTEHVPGTLRAVALALLAVSMAGATAAAGGAGTAAGATAGNAGTISSCTTISSSGVYTLTSNLTATDTTACILVTADDVTIDGNGYVIHGYDDDTFSGGNPEKINGSTAVHARGTRGDHVENVTVRDVTMRDGNVGFNATRATGVTLSDVRVTGADKQAITTVLTNGTVTLANVTVRHSGRFGTRSGGYYHYDSPVQIGASPAGQTRIRPAKVVVSDLHVYETGNDGETFGSGRDVTGLYVHAFGPVTVEDTVVHNTSETAIGIQADNIGYTDAVALSNVTVSSYGTADAADGEGIEVYSSESIVLGNVLVGNDTGRRGAGGDGPGIHLDAQQDVTLANATVRDVDGLGVEISGETYSVVDVRDVRVHNTTNSSGLVVRDNERLAVRDVNVTGTADVRGWAVDLGASDEMVVRNVSVADAGDGGLRIATQFGDGVADVSDVTVRNVRNASAGTGAPNGEGLTVVANYGTVSDVRVANTTGGVRIEETGELFSERVLSVENLTVAGTDHFGIDVRGDYVTLAGSRVRNTSKAAVVKRPPGTTDGGRFRVRNVSLRHAGTDGVTVRPNPNAPDDANGLMNLTNVSLVDATGDGVDLSGAGAVILDRVDVTGAGGVDLDLAGTHGTLTDVTLASARFDGTARNVTVEAANAGGTPALPPDTDDVGVYFEATNTTADGYLNVTVYYDQGDVPAGLDESTLELWRHDGSTWSRLGGTLDTAANTVTANVTSFSLFGPLGSTGTGGSGTANVSVGVDATNAPVTAGETLTVDATVTNTGNATGTRTVTLSLNGTQVDARSVTLDAGESRTVALSWTTASGDAGDHELAVASGNDTATVNVTVESDASLALTVDGGSVTVAEGDTATNTGTVTGSNVTLSASVGDVTRTAGGWEWSYAAGDGPDDGQQVTVTATDDDGDTTTVTFDLTVTNQPPSVAADRGTVTVTAGETATNTGSFADLGDDVTLSADVGTVTTTGSGFWEWTHDTSGTGTPTVTVTATDADGDTATVTFDVVVESSTTPSIAADRGNVTVAEGDTATVTGVVSGDGVTLTASVGRVNRTASGWEWSYAAGDGPDDGQQVTVTATDADGDAVRTTFDLSVTNRPPSVAADRGTVTVTAGETATNTGSFADPGDNVTLTASVGDVERTAGGWEWSHDTATAGSRTVTVTATDDDGDTATVTFDVVVEPADTPTATPTVTPTGTPTGTPPDTATESGGAGTATGTSQQSPGFGPVTALLAVAGAALLALWRRR